MACAEVSYFLFEFSAMPQPSHSQFCATIVLGCFGSVHSSACSAQLFQNHRIQFWDHFLKSWGALKQFLECHALQLFSRSDQKQLLMGNPMVTLSLKLCNSNCLDSRCTQKIDPLFEDSEDMQNIFTKGHMTSSLDARPFTFSDSSFGTVCLFLFVDCSSWPNLTAACGAQVAKRGILSSFRHGYSSSFHRGLVTILVHLYLHRIL